jgi:hypothetical protein
VSEDPAPDHPLSILSLAETRRYLRRAHARMMVVFFALLYALGSMLLGGMLTLVRVRGGFTTEILWGNALGQGPWNYPGLLIVAPWGVVSLPFLATLSMILVSVGVGIGISVAILISVRLVRDRKRSASRPGAVGSVAGLTPAMIALVTLGACCSTTAAATAGVGLVAQASGSTLNNLLVNNWYLDVFQVGVVFVALIAQEMLLRVYGGLLGLEPSADAGGSVVTHPAPFGLRLLAGGALRTGLLLAGITWSLAMFADWTTVSPFQASAALWFQWIFQHQLLAIVAILVALFPRAIADLVARPTPRGLGYGVRGGLLLAGISLALWVPPVVAQGGAGGFLNELFGVWGLPAAWGAVTPVFAPGVALYARWGLQYLLLGGFAIALALSPSRTMGPILATLGRTAVAPSGATSGAPVSARSVRVPPAHPTRGAIGESTAGVRGIRDP